MGVGPTGVDGGADRMPARNGRASTVASSSALSPAPTPSTPATSAQTELGGQDGLDLYARVYVPAWLLNVAQTPLPLVSPPQTARAEATIARHAVPAALLDQWAEAEAEIAQRINTAAMKSRPWVSLTSLAEHNYTSRLLHALRDEHIAMSALAQSATLYAVPLARRPAWNVTDSGDVVLYQLVARSSRENVPPIDLGDSVLVGRQSSRCRSHRQLTQLNAQYFTSDPFRLEASVWGLSRVKVCSARRSVRSPLQGIIVLRCDALASVQRSMSFVRCVDAVRH